MKRANNTEYKNQNKTSRCWIDLLFWGCQKFFITRYNLNCDLRNSDELLFAKVKSGLTTFAKCLSGKELNIC